MKVQTCGDTCEGAAQRNRAPKTQSNLVRGVHTVLLHRKEMKWLKGGWFTKTNKLFVGTQKEVVKS
jgi:hypothetical protein